MNKTKKVAWHKHLRKRKRLEEKARAARGPQTSRQTTPRR